MSEATILRRAQNAADMYDRHAFAQRLGAADLLAAFEGFRPKTILEPGCGTGIYTRMLVDAFPEAAIDATDIDERMLEGARRKVGESAVRFAVVDAHARVSLRYDAVTSNAAFQWLADLCGAVANLAGAVREGGMLSFSSFGPRTYEELGEALAEVFGPERRVTAADFADGPRLREILSRCCRKPRVEERRYSETFPSLRALLESIRYTGMRPGAQNRGAPWTPRAFERLERAYLARRGRIEATYQVFICSGVR